MRNNVDQNLDLACMYCGKIMKNENAHSSHLRTCTRKLEFLREKRKEVAFVFTDHQSMLNKWNSGLHDHLEIHVHKFYYSDRAIDWLRSEISQLNKLDQERLKKYCLFYLCVIAQIAGKPETRSKALSFVEELITEEEMERLKKEWPSLGKKRYEPDTDGYYGHWDKFIRIKEKVFFYVDFSFWIVLFDRHLLTFKNFGWKEGELYDDGRKYFTDLILNNYIELLLIPQYMIRLEPEHFNDHMPTDIHKYLNPSSINRFNRTDRIAIELKNMPYDPTSSESGLMI